MTLRDGEQSLELQPGELPGVYELGEEADNYLYQCITSGLISRSYHSRGLKITLWIREDVTPVRLSVSVNFIWTGLFTLYSCPCHSFHAFVEFAYSCCEITCKTCAKMCADYIKQSIIIHSPHTFSLPKPKRCNFEPEQVLEYSKSWVLRSSKYLKFRPNQELVSG